MPATNRRRRLWPWILVAILVVLLIPIAIVVVPILTHQSEGVSTPVEPAEEWSDTATALGDDGRERSLTVSGENAASVDLSALAAGDHVTVTGTGFDSARGIYVAVCVIPESPEIKPGPCLGGVPDQEAEQVEAGTVQWAPSNWINNDWAWKLFGARAYEDADAGTFTAYLELPDPVGEGIDCRVDRCGIVTRNDHTAAADRVQDVYVPIAYAQN